MTKSIALGACCALLSLCGQSFAADGAIPNDTLAAMGLGGVTLVSDDDASQVRGMGYQGHSKKPWSLAAGGSIAYVGGDHAGAGSVNIYAAEGKFYASGQNYSEAGKVVKKTTIIGAGPFAASKTTIKSIKVYAGGSSSASSF